MLYIHLPDSIHTYGLALELDNDQMQKRFIDLCYKYFINNKSVNDLLRPFHQSNSNKYNYFEMLGLYNGTTEKQDILLAISENIANELNLQLNIGEK